MPEARPIFSNLSKGELSPRVRGRTDLQHYYNGSELFENLINLKQGGARYAEGSKYVAEVKDSSKKVRLIPFEFSATQSYIIEVGNLYMRFYTEASYYHQVRLMRSYHLIQRHSYLSFNGLKTAILCTFSILM